MQLGVEDRKSLLMPIRQNSQLLHQEARMDWTWRINASHRVEFGAMRHFIQ
jgi:hypothetical protein